MPPRSAGLVPYRIADGAPQVMLVHPGGPFWKNRDDGAWSVAKGEYTDEDPLTAAQREFTEETAFIAHGEFLPLGTVTHRSGKTVTAWAFRGDFDARAARSNTFEMEWPPRSGRVSTFPEVDRVEWFSLDEARRKLLPAQVPFIDALEKLVSS